MNRRSRSRAPADRAVDGVWQAIRLEAAERAAEEPPVAEFLHDAVLQWNSWGDALASWLAKRLAGPALRPDAIGAMVARAFEADSAIGRAAALDLLACVHRDPACPRLHVPFLFYKGFHALQIYRVAHWHWCRGMPTSAFLLQHRCSEALAIDIHPAACIGRAVMLDHGTGFVAGETAVVEDDVSLLHGVTLGGNGKQRGDRHPKVRRGACIGACATILGNIEIGAGAKVGAGSVVLAPVPSERTAVGTRARLVDPAQGRRPPRLRE